MHSFYTYMWLREDGEHKQNISKAKLGVKKSEEARRNMVAAWEIRRKKAQNGK